jgi:ribose 5-phosphate isomerase B
VSRIAIGSDHAGFELKQHLIELLSRPGSRRLDLGTDSTESVDYVEYCANVGRAVRDGRADLGIVLGGSGQGEQLAANKVRGVRAALCNDLYTARMARAHNDANVLSMGARVVGVGLAEEILATFWPPPSRVAATSAVCSSSWRSSRSSDMPFPSDTTPDTEVFGLIEREVERQCTGLQLIASENFTSPAVMKAVGSRSPTSTPRATRASATTAATRSSTTSRRWRSSA